MKTEKIGIIGAMTAETEGLFGALENASWETVSGMRVGRGTLDGKTVVVTTSGIGKVFAAMAAEMLLLRYGVSALLNTGVAGGLAPDLAVCDAVVATDVVQHDMNTTALGEPRGFISGLEMIKIPTDPHLSDALCDAAAAEGIHTVRGTIASGDLFVADKKVKKDIRSRFGAIACEMEGGAVGQVACVAGVPFAVLRTISDGGDGMEYDIFMQIAAERSVAVTRRFLAMM